MSSDETIRAYVRVSSKSQGWEMQRDAIERKAVGQGEAIAIWYQEKASGKSIQRAELKRLRSDARQGFVRRLYIYRLDRLARSGIRDTFEVVEDLRENGVEIITVADGFSLTGPAAEVVLAVLAWAAKMERLATNERIASARVRMEAQGIPWGRPRRMTSGEVKRARRLRAEGKTMRKIAMHLGVPRSTIALALKRGQKS